VISREIDPSKTGQAVNAVHSIGILAREPLISTSHSKVNEPLGLAQSALQRLVTSSTTSDSVVVAGLSELALIAETLIGIKDPNQSSSSTSTSKLSKQVIDEFKEIARTVGAVGRGAVLMNPSSSNGNGNDFNHTMSPEGSDGGMGKEEAVFKAVSSSLSPSLSFCVCISSTRACSTNLGPSSVR